MQENKSTHYFVPFWIKTLFFWLSIASFAALIAFQISKRRQYWDLLINNTIRPEQSHLSSPPGFIATDIFNLKQMNLADYKNEVVLLHFWATWCVPCREEMPRLAKMAKALGKKIRIITIAVDENVEEVKSFFISIPAFQVIHDKEQAIAKQYNATTYPMSFIIAKDRLIKLEGPRPWNSYEVQLYLTQL